MEPIMKDGPMGLFEVKKLFHKETSMGMSSYYEVFFRRKPKYMLAVTKYGCFIKQNDDSSVEAVNVKDLKNGDKIWIDMTSEDVYEEKK